jgi:DNA polymerase-3 subunit alpha/error-prone DNA polymerase
MSFSSYFLVVRDIVRSATLLCGRGSGAASLVAYCLFITNVCPLKHNLYFERFLNPGRRDPPDIDVDFAWDERDAIQACHAPRSWSGLQPRSSAPDGGTRGGKVYGIPEAEISRLSKRLPWHATGWQEARLPACRAA